MNASVYDARGVSSERDFDRPASGDDGGDDRAPASEALPLTTLTRAASPDSTRSLDRERDDVEVSMTRSALVSGGEPVETRLFEAGELVDHFEVVELLGEGGMGAVYLAVDTKLGRRVALKVVQRSHLGSAKAVESFLYEARTTARFNHPHIVTVYAVGEHRGSPYVALEYLEGQTLQEILREGRLTLEPALRIGLAVAEALLEAHAHDVLHRDLKPANIVIPRDGRVRVLDFGLAKRIEGEAPPSTRLVGFGPREYTWAGAGTPAYMAPEQWRAEETTVATDVWAMGVLLFELFAGRRPFDEPSLVDQEQVVCGDDEAPRLERFASVPPELSELVARCTSKAVEERPSVSTIVEALRRMLGEPERLHFDGTRSTLRPPGAPVVSISGDANPTAPTLLLDSDGSPQAEVGTAETMLDPGSEPGLARDSLDVSRNATRRAETKTSPSTPPESSRKRAAPSTARTGLVAAVALLAGGAAVWLLMPRAPEVEVSAPAPATAVVGDPPPVIPPPAPSLEIAVDEEATAGSQPIPTGSAVVEASPAAVAPARPAKAPAPVLPSFDDVAAQDALQRRVKSAQLTCRFREGPRVFAVDVTFGTKGGVSKVRPHGRLSELGSSGRCVVAVMYSASVPPFSGSPQTRSVGVALKPRQ